MHTRIDSAAFKQLDLRVHEFLHDVPLHDVWVVDLPGGGDRRTIADVRALFSLERFQSANPIVGLLFKLRMALGRMLGWDRKPARSDEASYLSRLTAADRQNSLVEPGTPERGFRVLYVFPGEALSEIINATVHAFSALAIFPRKGGYTLYWAIYVYPVGRITRRYMALIDPFRRFLVYPALLRYLRSTWESEVNASGSKGAPSRGHS